VNFFGRNVNREFKLLKCDVKNKPAKDYHCKEKTKLRLRKLFFLVRLKIGVI
jgi:hypothetical protein